MRALFFDSDSLIWFETVDAGFISIICSIKRLKKLAKHSPVEQPYYHYHAIARSSDNVLYVGGRGVGPFIYDETSAQFETLPVNSADLPGYKREYDVSLILPFKDAQTWIGSLEGLYLYDRNTNYFEKIFPWYCL